MDRHNHFLPNDLGFQAPANDDGLAQLMPIVATQDSEIIANRERFLAGLRARGVRVVPPNPVRYTDAIIAAILSQPLWGEPLEPADEDVIEVGLDAAADGAEGEGVRLEDFVAYMQSHDYIFKPAGDFWPAARVNARLQKVKLFDGSGHPVIDEDTGEQKEIKPSVWLASHAAVEQMTWAPGLPQLIGDKLINEGGWIDRKGVSYQDSVIRTGRPNRACRWTCSPRLIDQVVPCAATVVDDVVVGFEDAV